MYNMGGKSKRKANIELLRLLAMMMVVSLHFLAKGEVLTPLTGQMGGTGYVAWFLESFSIMAVDVYVLISGYFLVETGFRVKRLGSLILQVLFYTLLVPIVLILVGIMNPGEMTFYKLLQYVLPVNMLHYWFVSAYVLLFLFTPVLNAAVKTLTQKQLQNTIFALLCMESFTKTFLPVRLELDNLGYDAYWFMVVYLIAAYIRLYGISFLEKMGKKCGLLFVANGVLIFGWTMFLRLLYLKTGQFQNFLESAYGYNHLLTISAAVLLFYSFRFFTIPQGKVSKVICAVSPYTFGVYLLHEHVELRYKWPNWLGAGKCDQIGSLLGNWALAILVVMLAGITIDALRSRLFEWIPKICRKGKILLWLFPIILGLYPLRHIWLGVELTDSAYSAGNYRFAEQINEMWLFATYLANEVGQLLCRLPGGNTFMGLNGYCAAIISMIAIGMYFFFVKVIKMPPTLAAFGELLAISLCWCPTTILYNYLTYFFFCGGFLCLYVGLIKERKVMLFMAGMLLGINVLVRFPNLAEAALILAVWYYGYIMKKRVKDVCKETGICVLGYAVGIGLVLAIISAKYGLTAYLNGITSLLNMPSDASDYSLYSMIITVLLDYKTSSRWLICMVLLVLVGSLLSIYIRGFIGKLLFTLSIAALFRWWYSLGVFNMKYYTYECMFQWVAVFLILTILLGMYGVCSKKTNRNQKLLSLMVLIFIGVTPLGSNNHLYPNMNNMFPVFGYTFYMLWEGAKLFAKEKQVEIRGRSISLFPIKAMLCAFLGVMCLQCILFGVVFTFRDGMSGQKRDTKIEKNAILKGMVTNSELAHSIEELTLYVEEKGYQDRELILYGHIPATSYFLDMPAAISTTWPDLRSYGYEVMVEDFATLEKEMQETKRQKPLVILSGELDEKSLPEEQKGMLIQEFLEQYEYKRDFSNARFIVYN